MSSPSVAPPSAPGDDENSPEPTLDEQVRADLIRFTERVAAEDRAIAQAHARRTEALVDMQAWSEQPQVGSRLHGSPESIRLADRNAATMTADQARAADHARWEDHEVARRTIVSETACFTRTAERTIDRQLEQARFLYFYAPATFDALAAGEISHRHALTLVDQLRTLPLEEQAAFEEAVLPDAKRLTVGRFRDRARRLRERAHPESIVTRSKNALADRRTYWEAAQDGMAWLHWYGTAHDTRAAYERICGMAKSLRKLGDPPPADGSPAAVPAQRTPQQLRADITAALLLDGVTPTGMGAGIRGSVMVTVPVFSLMGLSQEPATLEGYGPISPAAAREIAGHAAGFIRLLTHPETGVLLSVGADRYKVTKGVRKVLRVRDETCRFPGCTHPAVKSDIDHTVDWSDGGKTVPDNLAYLCEAHHRLKHLSKWQVKQEKGGVLVWSSPGRRSYRTDPANPLGPPRPVPPVVTPAKRTRPADETYLVPRRRPTRHLSPPVPDDPPF